MDECRKPESPCNCMECSTRSFCSFADKNKIKIKAATYILF